MRVAVYPRLADLLEEQHLIIQELERRIAERFGIDVASAGLQRLVERSPLRQTDLELAGAAAAALGVGLDDLFTVAALPSGMRQSGRCSIPARAGAWPRSWSVRHR